MDSVMSSDWWSRPEVTEILLKQFKRHVLGLLVAVKLPDETAFRNEVFTGFMLHHGNYYFWVSAGHVVKQVRELLGTKNLKEVILRWADDYNMDGAQNVPANIKPVHVFTTYHTDGDPDFGVIALTTFDVNCLLKNKNLHPIDSQIWYKHELSKPDGYYIIGLPEEQQVHKEVMVDHDTKRHFLQFSYCCLPIERLQYDDPIVNKALFLDPHDFYGKLVLPLEVDGLTSIVGMSGGPILSIERNQNGFVYRLFGIQKSWDKTRGVIRGEAMDTIIRILGAG